MRQTTKIKYLPLLLCLFFACTHRPSLHHPDSVLTDFDYPYPVLSFEIETQKQNLQLRYMDIGPQNTSKGTVVLLHGKNFAGFYWKQIAHDLSQRGYRVIIPDQIGFGKSSKPKNYQYSFSQMALNTSKLLKSLDIRNYDLVGHSMGGMLAVHFEQLYSNEVRKLVLINPIGLETYLDHVEYKDPEFFYNNELKKTVEQFRAYQKKNYYDGEWNESYEELLTPFKIWRRSDIWPLIAWNNALTYGPIFSEDIVSKFPNIKTPTFLIIGTRDRTGPGRGWKKEGHENIKLGQYQKLGKKAQRMIPGAKLHELKGLGHMPQFEDYQKFSRAFFNIFP